MNFKYFYMHFSNGVYSNYNAISIEIIIQNDHKYNLKNVELGGSALTRCELQFDAEYLCVVFTNH